MPHSSGGGSGALDPGNGRVENYYFARAQKYAYSLYLSKFQDESHWLLVYCIGDDNEKGVFAWAWHGMQGDDTDGIITKTIANQFNEKMNQNLSGVKREEIGSVIAQVFDVLGFLFLGVNLSA